MDRARDQRHRWPATRLYPIRIFGTLQVLRYAARWFPEIHPRSLFSPYTYPGRDATTQSDLTINPRGYLLKMRRSLHSDIIPMGQGASDKLHTFWFNRSEWLLESVMYRDYYSPDAIIKANLIKMKMHRRRLESLEGYGEI
jgi:hypothetical protein